jgi:hypothetical protein
MKTKLLLILLFVSSFMFAQVPTDAHKQYLFTGGSLVNAGTGGGGYNFTTDVYVNPQTGVADRDGVASNALSLNGTRLNGGDISATNAQAQNQEIAYSFWIKTGTVYLADLLNQWRIATNQGVNIQVKANGKLSCYTKYRSHGGFGYNNSSNYDSTVTINDNQWHHVVYQVYRKENPSNSNEYRYETQLYIDGVLNNSSQTGYLDYSLTIGIFETSGTTDRNLHVGLQSTGGAAYYDHFDDLRIYERELTANEISALADIQIQTWDQVGTAQFTNTSADVALALDSSGSPYVAYTDTTVDGMVHVDMFDGSNWVAVGSNVSPAIVPTNLSIAINPISGYPWVTYKDTGTNRQVVKKYDGTNWILDIADVFGFEPLSKVQLKIAANGDATIASTDDSATNQFHETLVIKRKNNGQTPWTADLSVVISEDSFDLVTANKIVAASVEGALTTDKRIIYEYNTGTWSAIYTSASVTTRTNSVSAGDDNRILNNVFTNSSTNTLTGENGIVTPPDNTNTKERINQLIYNQHSNNSYAFYVQSNNALRILENVTSTNTWVDFSPTLTMQANSSAKMELSQDGTSLYIAYMDANQVSVKKYTIILPLPVVYVDANASGAADGSSWADAFTEIQPAIDLSTPSFSEIWVAQGTYVPGTVQADTFLITDVVEIYGGFNGTETMLSQRNPKTNITILSGDLNNDDNATITNIEATRQDNAYHVITLKGDFSSGSIVDGFTITGGNASGSLSNSCSTSHTLQYAHDRGAAIYANPDSASRSVSVLLNNCIIEKNTSTQIAVLSTFSPCGASGTFSDIDFENCIIRDNYSVGSYNLSYGASGTYSNNRHGSLINCAIYNNESVNAASVVRISAAGGNGSACKVNIINTTMTKNISGISKTISTNNVSYCKIQNSIIYNNGGFQPIDITGNAPSSSNNIVQGAQLGGNPSDPLFVNANTDFALQATSPAVDTGDNSFLPSNITLDILGNDRIFNTTIDMGSYEYNSALSVFDNNMSTMFSVYPNPTQGILNINTEEQLKKIEVYNYIGQKVIESTQLQINATQLNSGMYLLKVYGENGKVGVKRFIKK